MSTKKPGRGTVVAGGVAGIGRGLVAALDDPPDERAATRSGRWRPDLPFSGRDGIKVTMRRIPGRTPPGVLEVPLRFQVPPLNDFSRKWGITWSRYSTLGDGERARSPQRPLFEQTLSTMLLDDAAQDDTLAAVVWTGAPEPQRLLEELRWIMGWFEDQEASVFKLTMSQTSLWPGEMLVEVPCALTDLQAAQKPGEVGVEYVDLSFLEIPDERLDRKGKGKKRATPADVERNEPVKDGESLHEFAQRMYRAASNWTIIRDANGISGVSPSSAGDLKAWLDKRDKRTLRVPALGISVGPTAVGGVD